MAMLIFPFGSHSPHAQAIATLFTEILVPSATVFGTALFAITIRTTACMSCSLLGAALTFGSPGLYPAYLHPRTLWASCRWSAMAGGLIRRTTSSWPGY